MLHEDTDNLLKLLTTKEAGDMVNDTARSPAGAGSYVLLCPFLVMDVSLMQQSGEGGTLRHTKKSLSFLRQKNKTKEKT